MVEGQGVDFHIVSGHFSIDDGAHILCDETTAGEHRALGTRFRAASVEDLDGIVVANRHIRFRVVRMRHPRIHRFPIRVSGTPLRVNPPPKAAGVGPFLGREP